MNNHQPVTSHHLRLFSQFAPYLVEEQPCNPTLGSILSRCVTADFYEVDGYVTGPIFGHFSPPRYSSARLRAIHLIHFERDLNVQRLEQRLGRMVTHAHIWWEAPTLVVSSAFLTLNPYIPSDVFVVGKQHGRLLKPDTGYQVCPAIDLPKSVVRFNQITPEDVAWAERQPAFPHSRNMPLLLTNYCTICTEQVVVVNNVVRITRGIYLPIEHNCPKVLVINGVPDGDERRAVVRPYEFPSEEAAQKHFEEKCLTFVGDGGALEVIEGFRHSPRANHSDQRETELLRQAQRHTRAGVLVGPTCFRCTAPIGKRKGTKFCSDRCRKRHHEVKGVN